VSKMINFLAVRRPCARVLFPLPVLMALVIGCATESPPERSSGPSTSQTLRSYEGPRREAVRREFTGWDPLVQALSVAAGGGSACQAVKEDRHEQGLALVLPATCVFPDAARIGSPSAAVIDAIATELRSATDHEFWIATSTPPRAGTDGRRPGERAAVLVKALIAAGVPPTRLVALMGPGDRADATSSPLAGTPLADVPTVEVLAVPMLTRGR